MRIHTFLGATLTAVLLAATLEPLRWWWCAWIAFAPYFYVTWKYNHPVQHTLIGYGIGLFYACIGSYWVIVYDFNIFLHAVFVGALPIALFFGGLTVSMHAQQHRSLLQVVLPPLLWSILLLCTERLSIGSILFEVPFYQPLPFLQLSYYGGMWILVSIVLLINTTLVIVLLERTRTTISLFACSILLAVIGWFAGNVILAQNPISTNGISVALIQPNFPADDAWKENNEDTILETYKRLAVTAAEEEPEMIIFPQYALPIDVYREPALLEELSTQHNATVVLASYVPTDDGSGISNMGFVFKPSEGLVHTYNSVTGPPFREIEQQYGDTFPTADTPAGTMGFLLCYENTVRWVAEEWNERGADFLASITNTGGFVGTVLPEYHIFQDRLRAIENRKPVVRITPNGYAAVIDQHGRTIATSSLDQEQVVHTYIPTYTDN